MFLLEMNQAASRYRIRLETR